MKKIIAVKMILFSCIAICIFINISRLFKDKWITFPWDVTRKINGFYYEPKNSLDFIFVGSSVMFTSVSPAVLWSEYGITSYDFAANEQPLWLSYFYIKEALKRQQPKAVVLDIFYSFFGEFYQREGVNRINLDDFPLSRDKIKAINNSVPGNERGAYFFTLMKYHTNWKQLHRSYFENIVKVNNPYKGYTPIMDYREYPAEIDAGFFQETERADLYSKNIDYLLKIIELCKHKNVELFLIKTPDSNVGNQRFYNEAGKFADRYGVRFLNFNTIMTGEGHNNIINAEKFSIILGEYLLQRYPAEDKRDNPDYQQWNIDSQYFYNDKEKYIEENQSK